MAMRLLQAHAWPGNVRELFAALESAHIRAGDRRIEAQHLPVEVRASRGGGAEAPASERYSRNGPPADERSAIEEALARHGGTRTAAARDLGMSRTTLWRKMKEYDIDG